MFCINCPYYYADITFIYLLFLLIFNFIILISCLICVIELSKQDTVEANVSDHLAW